MKIVTESKMGGKLTLEVIDHQEEIYSTDGIQTFRSTSLKTYLVNNRSVSREDFETIVVKELGYLLPYDHYLLLR